MAKKIKADNYSLSKKQPDARIAAPDLPYKPRDPQQYRPAIGLIACGGITEAHLTAYTKAGYNVVALCDLIEERALKRQKQFYPKADIYLDYKQLLARDDIEVVDIATHPPERVPLIEDALRAGKHVLSQKPFVLNLDTGEKFVKLAEQQGVKLAVNQNGRWAPYFSYIRQAVKQGLIGDLMSLHLSVHWDHSWTEGTPFENIYDLIFYDFAIHWFDITSHLLGDRKIHRVHATRSRAIGQTIRPPLLAQALVEFEGGQASLVFDAFVKYGMQNRTYIAGTKGTITSLGPDLSDQTVTLYTADGYGSPKLEGNWFPDGFHGSMSELLCAIEENREPINNARENLRSLALCFAAIASATDGAPKVPGEVRKLPPGSAPGAEKT
ncbi:MAG TPA: Gfo/Idh/MocA family oxidoreductase [Chthonomonadaceae bacterium]|nr:Gfo/Idh/MocA family oxidoreductase [Chthonomonadaceae bacterium]